VTHYRDVREESQTGTNNTRIFNDEGVNVTIVSQEFDHVIGVDTHAKTHTLVVLDCHGARQAGDTFPTSPAGLKRAQAWILRNAPGRVLVAMEGTASYGAQFSDLLTREGIAVAETRPPKRGVRRVGKTDQIDAELAARHTLALPVERVITPRTHTGDHAALSVLLTARNAIRATRTATLNQLTALLRGYGLDIDARKALTQSQILVVSQWRAHPSDDAGTATIRGEAIREAQEIIRRDSELTHNEAGLAQHVKTIAAWLLDEPGVGPFVAAQLIVAWSHKGRIHGEAAFARFAGVAPIPASSGNTARYRLHRGGDRQLNRALWVTAFNRSYNDPKTVEYVAKKTAEGKTRKEILRCLKRYISRSLFRKLDNQTA
jgi:transposase